MQTLLKVKWNENLKPLSSNTKQHVYDRLLFLKVNIILLTEVYILNAAMILVS